MIIKSGFRSVFPFSNGHFETIVPYYLRKVETPNYQRERLELDDGDFLDLDWLKADQEKVVVISHGLEGSSLSTHIKGQALSFFKNGYDVLVWNCRGCSGEINRLNRTYHSGESSDLKRVIGEIASRYNKLYLLGHSMGGNITVKYLCEQSDNLPRSLKAAMAISAPLCLASSSRALARGFNQIYTKHFIKTLTQKVAAKNEQFKEQHFDLKQIRQFNSFKEFDDFVTAPLHGFKDAEDYWAQCSTYTHLQKISCPTLILNAENDPFLEGNCYPTELAGNLPLVHLEIPRQGGHVGFMEKDEGYWNERRALDFFEQLI